MKPFLRALFSKGPIVIGLGSVLASVIAGYGWVAVVGALGAVTLALRRTFSSRRRLVEEASRTTGILHEIKLDDLERLRRELRRASRIPGAEHAGLQASQQFSAIHERFMRFRDVLAGRFTEAELTYGRYLSSAAEVYRSVIDNLRKAESLLKSIAGVDVDYVRARLRELGKHADLSESERREIEALKSRIALREQELQSVRDLLAVNEGAMTQLVAVTSALANVTTSEGLASVTVETAMAELEELAKRTETYSLKRRA